MDLLNAEVTSLPFQWDQSGSKFSLRKLTCSNIIQRSPHAGSAIRDVYAQ